MTSTDRENLSKRRCSVMSQVCEKCKGYTTWDIRVKNIKTGKFIPMHVNRDGFMLGDGTCPVWKEIHREKGVEIPPVEYSIGVISRTGRKEDEPGIRDRDAGVGEKPAQSQPARYAAVKVNGLSPPPKGAFMSLMSNPLSPPPAVRLKAPSPSTQDTIGSSNNSKDSTIAKRRREFIELVMDISRSNSKSSVCKEIANLVTEIGEKPGCIELVIRMLHPFFEALEKHPATLQQDVLRLVDQAAVRLRKERLKFTYKDANNEASH